MPAKATTQHIGEGACPTGELEVLKNHREFLIPGEMGLNLPFGWGKQAGQHPEETGFAHPGWPGDGYKRAGGILKSSFRRHFSDRDKLRLLASRKEDSMG